MAFVDDMVNRVSKRFQIEPVAARKLVIETLEKEISRQASLYVVDVELCDEPPSKFLQCRNDLLASIPPELPKAAPKK